MEGERIKTREQAVKEREAELNNREMEWDQVFLEKGTITML